MRDRLRAACRRRTAPTGPARSTWNACALSGRRGSPRGPLPSSRPGNRHRRRPGRRARGEGAKGTAPPSGHSRVFHVEPSRTARRPRSLSRDARARRHAFASRTRSSLPRPALARRAQWSHGPTPGVRSSRRPVPRGTCAIRQAPTRETARRTPHHPRPHAERRASHAARRSCPRGFRRSRRAQPMTLQRIPRCGRGGDCVVTSLPAPQPTTCQACGATRRACHAGTASGCDDVRSRTPPATSRCTCRASGRAPRLWRTSRVAAASSVRRVRRRGSGISTGRCTATPSTSPLVPGPTPRLAAVSTVRPTAQVHPRPIHPGGWPPGLRVSRTRRTGPTDSVRGSTHCHRTDHEQPARPARRGEAGPTDRSRAHSPISTW